MNISEQLRKLEQAAKESNFDISNEALDKFDVVAERIRQALKDERPAMRIAAMGKVIQENFDSFKNPVLRDIAVNTFIMMLKSMSGTREMSIDDITTVVEKHAGKQSNAALRVFKAGLD